MAQFNSTNATPHFADCGRTDDWPDWALINAVPAIGDIVMGSRVPAGVDIYQVSVQFDGVAGAGMQATIGFQYEDGSLVQASAVSAATAFGQTTAVVTYQFVVAPIKIERSARFYATITAAGTTANRRVGWRIQGICRGTP